MTRTPSEPRQGRIIVGVDGSEPSKAALRWAARIAPAVGSDIEAMVVWEIPTTYGWALAYTDGWRPEVDAAKMLETTLDDVFGPDRPKNLAATVREGKPSRVLMAASTHATMLVVGSRGHGGFAGLLLGSVSATCAEHATCPVLVVHGEEPIEPPRRP